MKTITIIVLFVSAFHGSFGIKCKSDPECVTGTQMAAEGKWEDFKWEEFMKLFGDQPTSPCFKNYDSENLYCFSKKTFVKQCTCWDDTEWCNQELYGKDHTMCIYKNFVQKSCGLNDDRIFEVIYGAHKQAVKNAIVDKHNELRAKVANGKETRGNDGTQPKAANMRKLVWNEELAEIAQRWIDQCAGAHDKERRTDAFAWVGQNWAKRSLWKKAAFKTQEEVAVSMVERWFDEVKDMTINALTDPTGENNGATGVIGNYTQAAWAETTDVGCGYLSIKKGGYRKGSFLKSYMACNYGPGGNIGGRSIYEQGEPGSKCPTGTTKTAEGLCA